MENKIFKNKLNMEFYIETNLEIDDFWDKFIYFLEANNSIGIGLIYPNEEESKVI